MAGLTPWQKHVQKTLKAGGTMKQASKTFKKKGSSDARKKSTRTFTGRSKSTTIKTSRSSSRKPDKIVRRKGDMERKKLKIKKEFDDFARALGVPLSKTVFKVIGNRWHLKAGKVSVKRVKLSEAMTLFRRKARKRL